MTGHGGRTVELIRKEARESRLRSLAKALSYRIIGTLTTAAVAAWVTGDVAAALAIGAIEPFAKVAIFYGHERAWEALPLFRNDRPDGGS